MTTLSSPQQVLFFQSNSLAEIPLIDHYAGNETMINKAMLLQQKLAYSLGNKLYSSFDVTCDCEDGAVVGHELEHARMIVDCIFSENNHFARVGVRIHDVNHPLWRKELDILIVAASKIAYITLPKVCSVDDAMQQISYLRQLEKSVNLSKPIPVHVLIETHGAVHQAWEIAALPGVESLDFGLMDFVSDHLGAIPAPAMKSPLQFTHPLLSRAKCELVAAALAHGKYPTHNVCTELNDLEYIADDAKRAKNEFGFLRMWSIHPKQILPILSALRPSIEETQTASEILILAAKSDWGPIKYAGKMHDRASFRYYYQVIKQAFQSGESLPAEIIHWFHI